MIHKFTIKTIAILFCILSINKFGTAQTTISMQKHGGVYVVPCKVNNLSLQFIFDTGASDVSISLTEAVFMLKNGYLSENDILGREYYSIANGDIVEGTKINIKEIEFAGLRLYNVEASISHQLSAPLLLGQSVISRLGKILIDPDNNTLTVYNGKGVYDYTASSYQSAIAYNEIIAQINGLITKGRVVDAEYKLKQAITYCPSNSKDLPNLYCGLAKCYDEKYAQSSNVLEQNTYFELALKNYGIAIQINPSFFDALYNVGALHYNKAAAITKEMNKLGMSKADNERYDALMLQMKSLFEMALPYFKKAYLLKPEDVFVQNAIETINKTLNK